MCLEELERTDKLISEPECPAWQQSTGVQSVCEIGAPVWGRDLGYEPMTKQLEALLIRCDVRMLRYLMGIR